MSITRFKETIKKHAFQSWLKSIDRNIVYNSIDSIRAKEQVASKTSFYITTKQIQDIYYTITGRTLAPNMAENIIENLYLENVDPSNVVSQIKVGKDNAVYFSKIGWDTISKKLSSIFDNLDEVQIAYRNSIDSYIEKSMAELKASDIYTKASASKKQELIDEVLAEGNRRGTLGFYYNKGHVISIATNAAKKFRLELERENSIAKEIRDDFLRVIDTYISKLEQDDKISANLPDEVGFEFYAEYTKSPDKYLVEMQLADINQQSGRASIAYIEELRKLFLGKITDTELSNILKNTGNSNTLGQALLTSEGSPSYLQMLANKVAAAITGTKPDKTVYKTPKIKIGEKKVPVKKKSRKKDIQNLKNLKSKIKSTNTIKKETVKILNINKLDLLKLQNLINSMLTQRIKENMGSGNRRDILNLRSGRFAESVKVERMSESRQGMITAFYTYMKNPYATFSEGGRQEFPRSRDPKLLISKSIRDIAAQQVANKLRAVSL